MTSEESEAVGWDGDMLNRWPGKIVRQIAAQCGDRLQMIRWIRYLEPPVTKEEHTAFDEITKVLQDTLPEQKPERILERETVKHKAPEGIATTLDDLLDLF